MSELQRRALLLEHGFSVDQCNELTVVGFPDGHDGLVLDSDEFAGLQIEELLLLGSRRQRVLQALAALLHARKCISQVDDPGYVYLENELAFSWIFVAGLPLTFWLRRESDLDVLRRFLAGFVAFYRIDDDALSDAFATPASSSIAKPTASTARIAQDYEHNPQSATPPGALNATLPLWATLKVTAPLASAPGIPLAEKLRRRLQSAKAQMLDTQAIWLAANRLWVADDDAWITPSELVAAAALRLDSWIGQGHAQVLLRFAPETYREEIRTRLLREAQDRQLEDDVSQIAIGAHFLADAPIAEWVMTADYECRYTVAVADSRNRNALYASWWKLRYLATAELGNPRDWLWEIRLLQEQAGWHNLRPLLDPPTRIALERRLQQTLQYLRGDPEGWMAVEDVALLALTIGSRPIGEALLVDPVWQSALLYNVPVCKGVPNYSGPLKYSILALSLLAPGVDLRRLIERAYGWYDRANKEPYVDNTTLALAIAWHRCDRAEGRTA